MPKRSVELREEAKTKHTLVGEVVRLAGEDRDFSKKEILDKLGATDSADAVKKWRGLCDEAHELFDKATDEEVNEEIKAYQDRDEQLKTPKPGARGRDRHPEPPGEETLGRLFAESKAYKDAWVNDRQIGIVAELPVSLKTLLTTSAGFAPRPPRIADVVPFAVRPIQILDLIPIDQTMEASIIYMEKTTNTISAAELLEAGTYPESTYVWTERTSTVRKIGDSIPVTDEQIDDVPQMAGLLDTDLRFGVRQRLDTQVVNGNGTAPNLLGISNVVGIQTQARGTDPHFDAVFKAITKVRAVGRAEPDAIAVHSTDWQTFRLTRTADGIYIMGNPAEQGPMNLWGIPVAINEVLTVGTALVGDFGRFSHLWERKGIEVQIGLSGTQFVEGKKTLRADTRVAFVVRRPAAFATVSGL
ncbi:MAG: phage major capsid protein [Candidatus Rokuibacteriota bacterium]